MKFESYSSHDLPGGSFRGLATKPYSVTYFVISNLSHDSSHDLNGNLVVFRSLDRDFKVSHELRLGRGSLKIMLNYSQSISVFNIWSL